MTIIVETKFQVLDYIYPDEKNIDKNKLMLTDEGLYSVSGKEGSKFLANLIYKNTKRKDLIITDGTANNGSDTLMLAKYFYKVNSIELNEINFKVLKNNVDVYNYKNINLINGDTLKELNNLKQDVIYIDAPWGGSDYKKQKQVKLFMSNKELSDIYNKFKNNTLIFIFKVPYNYDINNFIIKTKINNFKIYSFKKKDNIRFLILFIKTKKN